MGPVRLTNRTMGTIAPDSGIPLLQSGDTCVVGKLDARLRGALPVEYGGPLEPQVGDVVVPDRAPVIDHEEWTVDWTCIACGYGGDDHRYFPGVMVMCCACGCSLHIDLVVLGSEVHEHWTIREWPMVVRDRLELLLELV